MFIKYTFDNGMRRLRVLIKSTQTYQKNNQKVNLRYKVTVQFIFMKLGIIYSVYVWGFCFIQVH